MKVIGKIFAGLFSVLYFFVLIVLMTLSFSLNFVSKDYYSSIAKSIDLKTIKAKDLGDTFKGANLDENATLEDALVKFFENSEVDKDFALEVINNETVRTMLGKYVGEYINYTISGERPVIEKSDIETLLNEQIVKELFKKSPENMDIDVDMLYEQLKDLLDEMEENGGEIYDNTERSNNVSIPN